MHKGLNTAKMSREDWLKARQSGIGGSDAAAICGLSPWGNKASVFLSKTEPIEDDSDNMSERLRVGHDLEEYVAKRFCEATGKKVRRNNFMLHDDKYPFLLADIDREVVGEDAILECKTTNSYAASDWKDEPPAHYQIQCLHYLMITGAQRCYIAVLIGNERFAWFTIERDEETIEALRQIEVGFWKNYVEKNEFPPPDGSSVYDDVLKKRFPVDNGSEALFSTESEVALERYLELKTLIKDLETEMKAAEQVIKNDMGEATRGMIHDHKISWKTQSRTTLDSKAIKKEMPDVYEKYSKVSESRVFRVG